MTPVTSRHSSSHRVFLHYIALLIPCRLGHLQKKKGFWKEQHAVLSRSLVASYIHLEYFFNLIFIILVCGSFYKHFFLNMVISCLPLQSFANGFCLHEQQQIVSAARFGVGAGHVEAAKRLYADQSAGALTIQIEVPYMEISPSLL